MDPLWSETCWSTSKYFIILIVSTYYILCISWIIKCLNEKAVIYGSKRLAKDCLYCSQDCVQKQQTLFLKSGLLIHPPPHRGAVCFHVCISILWNCPGQSCLVLIFINFCNVTFDERWLDTDWCCCTWRLTGYGSNLINCFRREDVPWGFSATKPQCLASGFCVLIHLRGIETRKDFVAKNTGTLVVFAIMIKPLL